MQDCRGSLKSLILAISTIMISSTYKLQNYGLRVFRQPQQICNLLVNHATGQLPFFQPIIVTTFQKDMGFV
jgi:hypothetical protein